MSASRGGAFSPVFMWTHRDPSFRARFIRLSTRSGALVATPGHYVYAGVRGSGRAAMPIEDVAPGDVLFPHASAPQKVLAAEVVDDVGLFNPQTLHGDVLVDGFEVTTYTTAVRPIVAHRLLAPFRQAWLATRLDFSASVDWFRDGLAFVSV